MGVGGRGKVWGNSSDAVRAASMAVCSEHGSCGLGELAPHRKSKAVPSTRSLVQGCHAVSGPEVDVGSAQAQRSNHLYGAFRLGGQRQGGL